MDQRSWADLLATTVDAAAAAVASPEGSDWSVPILDLEWSARETLAHIASCHVGYAGQLTAPRARGWVPFEARLEDEPGSDELAEVLRATGGILVAVVGTTPPGTTTYHPYGMAGACDSAAMGIVETVVHVDDLARTLGFAWVPDRVACHEVLRRLFPDVEDAGEPWPTLQWATGRIALPTRPRRTGWRWTNRGG